MATARVLATLVGASMVAVATGASKDPVIRAVNTGVSIMLLGSIGFMMGLFYLVNQKNDELRKYSWMVISSTISIFSAVLLFQAVNGIVEEYILGKEPSEIFELMVSMLHFLAWFLLLQFLLGVLSGSRLSGARNMTEMDRHFTELNLKTGGILLGHLAGFAAINTFAVLQRQLPHTFLVSILCFPLAWLSVFLLSRLTQVIRTKAALADGYMDECEKNWDAEAAETENDVTGLAASFMVIQALRLLIGGTLPNAEGQEPDDVAAGHTDLQVWLLCTAGLLFVVIDVVRIIRYPTTDPRLSERLLPQLKNIIAMDFAWAVFFSSQWFVAAHFFRKYGGMMQEITVALFVTSVALGLIFILGKIEDMEKKGSAIDSACAAVIKAIAVLIGFSWEKAFDRAAADFTSAVTFIPHTITKLILALLLALLVIPAWRLHILPAVLAFEELEHEMEEEASKKEGDAEAPPDAQKAVSNAESGPSPEDISNATPLLPQVGAKKSRSAVGLSVPALQRKCMTHKAKILQLKTELAETKEQVRGLQTHKSELKERNADLEATLASISHELAEMQKMADMLAK